jgi:hypothetical protein
MCQSGRLSWSLLGLLLVMLTASSIASGDAALTEYQVKAAFLVNFAQFIEWPDGTFTAADSPIVVGVLGEDPFGDTLEKTFADVSAQGRRLVVRRGSVADDMRSCQLLFVSRSERDRTAEILATMKDLSIVTVSEIPDFARRGGIINFYIENKKVRFEINAGAAERKQLKISSQLLKRARVVD